MSNKQQQILQMAKDICRVKLNCNDVCNPISACDALKYAERAVEAGYKKQNEVAREIFEEIESEIVAALQSNYRAKQERVEKQLPDDFVSYMCEGKIAALRGIEAFVEELKKKYTEGKNEKTYK